jgi:hypothetical protein
MQLGGERQRVKLKVNLERYGKGLVEGSEGWTIPNVKLSVWGSQDRFVAVEFDNGLRLDVLYSGLEILSKPELSNKKSTKGKLRHGSANTD